MLCCAQDIDCTTDKSGRVVDEENLDVTIVLNAGESNQGECTSRIAMIAGKPCLRMLLKYYSG